MMKVLTYNAYNETIEEKERKESEVKQLQDKYEQDMKTMRAAGYYFYTEREMREFSRAKREKMTAQDIIEEVLRERKKAAGL
jgi:hypothetical protein